jgi:hypothetical protein
MKEAATAGKFFPDTNTVCSRIQAFFLPRTKNGYFPKLNFSFEILAITKTEISRILVLFVKKFLYYEDCILGLEPFSS